MEVLAFKATTAFSGIEIVGIDHAEGRICYRYRTGTKTSRRTWSTIRYNMEGDPYFIAYGLREYLSDYMRGGAFNG